MPYQNVMYLPYFLIIIMTMQEYMLLQTFSVLDSQISEKYSVVYHIHCFDFQRRIKKLYTLRMKNPTMDNPQLHFPFPIPTLKLSDTSPTKDVMTKFAFFCSKYKALGFAQFP